MSRQVPLAAFLRLGLRSVLVLALVFTLGAFLTGPSITAVRTREGLVRRIGWLRGGAESAGLRTARLGVWVYAHKQALRIGAVAVAGLALVFWGQPTGKIIILLAVLLLVALAVIEFLGRPPQPSPGAPTPDREPSGQLQETCPAWISRFQGSQALVPTKEHDDVPG